MTSPSDLPPAPEAAVSVLTLTEDAANPGAFTIGMKLASSDQPAGQESYRIPVVDIVLLAVINTLKNLPQEFKAELDRVNSAIQDLSAKLNAGEDAEDALATFQATVGVDG